MKTNSITQLARVEAEASKLFKNIKTSSTKTTLKQRKLLKEIIAW